MRENDWTRLLGWPGYKVYRSEIEEPAKQLTLWVRRKRGNKQLVCSGCGRLVSAIVQTYEREVRDLPWSVYRTTVVVELYRVRCPDCGVKTKKVPLLPNKAPFSERFEDAVGQACESAAASRVGKQYGLSASTVRAIEALSGTLGAVAAQAGPAADGRGRDLSGQEAEVHYRGEQSSNLRAALVRRGTQEGDAQ
jgi:transposase